MLKSEKYRIVLAIQSSSVHMQLCTLGLLKNKHCQITKTTLTDHKQLKMFVG